MPIGFARRPLGPPLVHDAEVDIEGVTVRLKVNPRARRISLRLDVRRGEMVATAPTPRRLADALAFARSKARWIEDCLRALPVRQGLQPGDLITFEGAPLRLERAAMRIKGHIIRATADEPHRLLASGEGEAFGRAVVRVLKSRALECLKDRTAVYAVRLGRPQPEVQIGDPKSRWGSCRGAHAGAPPLIRYSWRLILAPSGVLDYVAAHECAHLIEPNHSPAFWTLVDKINGDPAAERQWLRRHGRTLHAVGP